MTEPKPLRADARRNYDRLLHEAKRAFAERGVDASLEDVARHAGVGIGTLYRHFPTREALLEAVLRERFESQAVAARELAETREPAAALYEWLLMMARTAGSYHGLTEILADALNDPGSQLYASCHRMQEAGSHLVERAKAAGGLREDVTQRELFLLLHAISWVAGRHPDGDGEARFLDLVFAGLRPS